MRRTGGVERGIFILEVTQVIVIHTEIWELLTQNLDSPPQTKGHRDSAKL